MPKKIHEALTSVAAKALVQKGAVGRHADGAGLYLHVTGQGQAKWALRYMLNGKSREMGLGAAYHSAKGDKVVAVVSLADARVAAKVERVKLDAGVDPVAEKEAAKAERKRKEAETAVAKLAEGDTRTFKAAFEGWLADHGPAMRTERQRVFVRGLMANHVLTIIGEQPVATLTTADMLKVLRPIWRTKAETALRARIRCEAVLAWAKGHGWRQGENPAAWKNNLEPMLGRQGDAARVTHHKALHWRDMPGFICRLEAETSTSALALRWVILTACRTAEVLGATWAEIDMQAPGGPLWIIPSKRMKMGVEHRVPLSRAALAVLEAAEALRKEEGPGGGFLFPGGAGSRGGRVAGGREGAPKGGLSSMALLGLLRRMQVAGEATPHGCRSTFRTWIAECTATPEAVAEACLAHAVGSEVQRSYNHSDLVEKRRALMEAWAGFCAKAPAAVASLRRA